MSMKKSNGTIGIRSRDLPVCSEKPLRHRVPPYIFFINVLEKPAELHLKTALNLQ
jgi:hypothetical protein